ncbi:MAG: glycosyltransferase involved in cell wall biosynthesis [Salibacteraceae bacterium]|jgi:glycosyltransferase involved in cell wall biosynthesis
MIQLSIVIITFNEEVNIERCLLSVKNIADEVVVVDSFSTDKTKQICEKYKVRFIENEFLGHIEQKNFALKKAKYDYVLSLDADEAISPELERSIIEVKNNWMHSTYKMNRLTNYCGDWIKHGSWYPDTKLRLVKKDVVVWAGDNPHDRLVSLQKKKAIHLKGDILHYSYYSISEHILQQEKFSSIAAQALYKRGEKAPLYKLFVNPLASVIKDILLRSGYLDGVSGFKVAEISAKSVFWKYKKLRDLWKEARPK